MIQKLNNVEAIVAVDKNFGLAKENTIPWKSKKDMEFFKRKTIYNIVIMGSKTLFSLPNGIPLKDRLNIVITRNKDKYLKKYEKYNNLLFVDENEIVNFLFNNNYENKTIFIIVGLQIYNLLLPYCSRIWLTKIKQNYDCDLIFDYDISTFESTIEYDNEELEIIQLN
jgi:dihydrofolate reductase